MWQIWMIRIVAVLGCAGFCLAAFAKLIQMVTLMRSGSVGSQLILASLGYQFVVFLACAAALTCIAANVKQVRIRGPDH